MTLLFGILLASACAMATNIGFLYKHRGVCAAPPVDIRRPLRCAISLYKSPLFALGMLIAVGAWIFHVAAMSLAPLSVVQAVMAGGIVLLAVLAERIFGLHVGRRQWIGLGMTAIGLVLLGVSLPQAHGADSQFSLAGMIAFEAVLVGSGTLLIMGPQMGAPREHHGLMLGAAAGFMFGVSDVSIKAISGLVGSEGIFALVSPWAVVAVIASVAGFYACAKSLQDGEAVPVIAVTGTAANVAGIVGGIIVFGDPLSGSPLGLLAEAVAFTLVLLAAWLMPAPVRATGSGVRPALAAAAA